MVHWVTICWGFGLWGGDKMIFYGFKFYNEITDINRSIRLKLISISLLLLYCWTSVFNIPLLTCVVLVAQWMLMNRVLLSFQHDLFVYQSRSSTSSGVAVVGHN